MWLFTAYALRWLAENRGKIRLEEFHNFMFRDLWERGKIVLNDTPEELNKELEYLEKLGLIEIGNGGEIQVKDEGGLKKLAEYVKSIGNRTGGLWDIYIERIDNALKPDSR